MFHLFTFDLHTICSISILCPLPCLCSFLFYHLQLPFQQSDSSEDSTQESDVDTPDEYMSDASQDLVSISRAYILYIVLEWLLSQRVSCNRNTYILSSTEVTSPVRFQHTSNGCGYTHYQQVPVLLPRGLGECLTYIVCIYMCRVHVSMKNICQKSSAIVPCCGKHCRLELKGYCAKCENATLLIVSFLDN